MEIKNIHLYNYTLIHTQHCELYIKNGDDCIFIPCGNLVLLEKNTHFDVTLIRKSDGHLYDVIMLEHDMLLSLKKILEPVIKIPASSYLHRRTLKNKVFKIRHASVALDMFKILKKGGSSISILYKLAYIFSESENIGELIASINTSLSIRFSERVRRLLSSDLSRRWNLSDISDKLYISEVAVRKKLEREAICFNQLLLDTRMHKAIIYILESDITTSQISELLGYSSVSYFIRIFKSYYGITPKQFDVYYKRNFLCS